MSLATKTTWPFIFICCLVYLSEGCYPTQIATLHLATYTFPRSLRDQVHCVRLQAKDKNNVVKVTLTTATDDQQVDNCPHTIHVYDGRSNNTTVLLKACGPGRFKREVHSSGPNILVQVVASGVSMWNYETSISYTATTVTSLSDPGQLERSTFGPTEIIPLVSVPILVLIFAFIVCSKRRKKQQLRQEVEDGGPSAQDLLRAMTAALEENGSSCCHHDLRHFTVVENHRHYDNSDPLQEALITNQHRKGRVRHPAGDVQRDSNDLDAPYPNVFQTQDPTSVPFLSATFDPQSDRYDAPGNFFPDGFHDNDKEGNLSLVSASNVTSNEYSIPVDPLPSHQNPSDITKPISITVHRSPSSKKHRRHSPRVDDLDSTGSSHHLHPSRHRRHSPRPDDLDSTGSSHRSQGHCRHSPRPDDLDSTGSSHRSRGHRRSNLDNLSSSSNSVLTFYGPVDPNVSDALLTSSGTLMTSSGTDISLLDRNEQQEVETESPPPSYDEVTCGGRFAPTNQS